MKMLFVYTAKILIGKSSLFFQKEKSYVVGSLQYIKLNTRSIRERGWGGERDFLTKNVRKWNLKKHAQLYHNF